MIKLLYLLIYLSALNAHDPYQEGKKLYIQKGCYSCHGNKAEGLHEYPYLANRAKGFLSYKLKRFRNKISDNQQQEMMIPFATSLDDDEIDALTTFLSDYKEEALQERYDDSYEVHGDGGS